ncbi:hypothetical protein AYO44_03910 [Planctomycetaceae bacterium SCGC AG-212-F19]|nr:hypothetical protein AYO44_03910 [Planctomycetaceae bacterium SCGC AG-212-F19]
MLSTMAALLACHGLALGQAPEFIVSGQPTDGSRPMQRGLLRPVGAVTTMQPAGPGAASPAPMPMPMPMPMPAQNGEMTGPPRVGCNGGCGDGGCCFDPAAHWSDDYSNWVTGEYILWRFGGSFLRAFNTVVPLGSVNIQTATVTFINGVATSSAQQSNPVPLQVQVTPSFPGGNGIDFRDQSGIRLSAGHWFDEDKCFGMEASVFWLPRHSVTLANLLNPQVVTVDTHFAQQQLTINTSQGIVTTTGPTPVGDVFFTANLSSNLVGTTSNEIGGFEVNGRSRVFYMGAAKLDLIGGARFMLIHQKILMTDTINVSPAGNGQVFSPLPPPVTNTGTGFFTGTATVTGTQTATTTDSINGYNDFVGPQIGASFEFPVCWGFYVSGYGKLAIGDMHQRFDVTGNTTGTTPQAGGMIVGGSDQPHQTSDRICFMPEGNLTIGYTCGSCLRLFAGYDVTFMSAVSKLTNVTFAGTTAQTITLSTSGNTSSTGGTTSGGNATSSGTLSASSPGIRISSASTSLQGLNIGLELRW